MKKWSYLLSGVLIGAVVATTGSAFADQIKSMVGQTVAGEYAVKVNGNSLSENAIVVDGKAHVPLRSVSDSLGAGIKVEGKTIQISTGSSSDTKVAPSSSSEENYNFDKVVKEGKFTGWSIVKLEQRKTDLEKYIPDYENSKQKLSRELEIANKLSESNPFNSAKATAIGESNAAKTKKELENIENDIINYKTELEEINKAIASLK